MLRHNIYVSEINDELCRLLNFNMAYIQMFFVITVNINITSFCGYLPHCHW